MKISQPDIKSFECAGVIQSIALGTMERPHPSFKLDFVRERVKLGEIYLPWHNEFQLGMAWKVTLNFEVVSKEEVNSLVESKEYALLPETERVDPV